MSNGNGGDPDTWFTGSVKWFNVEKGYGFITKPDSFPGDRDVFLHVTKLPKGITALTEGALVTFQVESGKNGFKAINVQLDPLGTRQYG